MTMNVHSAYTHIRMIQKHLPPWKIFPEREVCCIICAGQLTNYKKLLEQASHKEEHCVADYKAYDTYHYAY